MFISKDDKQVNLAIKRILFQTRILYSHGVIAITTEKEKNMKKAIRLDKGQSEIADIMMAEVF